MAELRIGLLGAGTIGRDHLATFKHLEGTRVTAIADSVRTLADQLAVEVGATAHGDYRELIGKVDLVWVCTPPFLHADQVSEFADAHIHVFCEKPIALDLASADRMVRGCRQNGVHLMIGQVIRYFPETIKIKELIDQGEVGDIVFAHGHRLTVGNPSEWPVWRREPSLSGGFAIESGIHEVDTVRTLAGEIASVYARVAYALPEFPEVDSDFRALVTLHSGASAEIHESLTAPMRDWSWGVVGTKATAVSPKRGEVRLARIGVAEPEVIAVGPTRDPARGLSTAMLAENQEFVDAVRADRVPAIPGEEGRRNLAVLLAAFQSAREGRVVPI